MLTLALILVISAELILCVYVCVCVCVCVSAEPTCQILAGKALEPGAAFFRWPEVKPRSSQLLKFAATARPARARPKGWATRNKSEFQVVLIKTQARHKGVESWGRVTIF